MYVIYINRSKFFEFCHFKSFYPFELENKNVHLALPPNASFHPAIYWLAK